MNQLFKTFINYCGLEMIFLILYHLNILLMYTTLYLNILIAYYFICHHNSQSTHNIQWLVVFCSHSNILPTLISVKGVVVRLPRCRSVIPQHVIAYKRVCVYEF